MNHKMSLIPHTKGIARCLILLSLILTFQCSGAGQSEEKNADIEKEKDNESKTIIQDLCWSADGRTIYFSAIKVKPDFSDFSPDRWATFRYDLDSKETSLVEESSLNITASPSGALLISKVVDDKRHLYLKTKDEKTFQSFFTNADKAIAPAYSPDGQYIAFMRVEGEGGEIYRMDADGNNIVQLTHTNGHRAYNPDWSPDGNRIVYYLEKGDRMDQIHIMQADGADDRNITRDTFNNFYPAWINDSMLVYSQGKGKRMPKVMSIHQIGTQKRPLLGLESMFVRYSPDGSRIAVVKQREGKIEVIDLSGKKLFDFSMP